MKRYLIFAATMFALAALYNDGRCAARTPEELAKEIAPLVSENTVCVVHVDISTLEPEQAAEKLKEICNVIRSAAAFDERLAREMNLKLPQDEFIDTVQPRVTMLLNMVRDDCGVTDFYYLVALPFQDCIVVPIREGVKTEFFDEQMFVEHKGFMLLPNMRVFQSGSLQREWVERMFGRAFMPADRPEIVEGLTLAGDRPVRAAAFWPSYARMLITQTTPELPAPFDGISPEQVFDGLQLVAAGFDPNSVQGELIIQSKDQVAAETFRGLLLSLPDRIMQMLETQPAVHPAMVPALMFAHPFKENADFLFPPPENGLITLQLPGDDFAANMQTLFESVVENSKHGIMGKINTSTHCANKMKMIMLAMHNYHDAWRCLPQAYTLDADGKPLHSWRVALLPYLEETQLYEQIRRDEPWDSEWNKQFHDKCPDVFRCESLTDEEITAGMASYSLVVGTQCYPQPGRRPFTFSQIADGLWITICLVELQTPVNWMDPAGDLTQEQAFLGPADPESGIGLRHEVGGKKAFNTGRFDGSVHTVAEDIPLETWKALLTHAGGESVHD